MAAEGQQLGWGVVIQQISVGGRQFFDVLLPGQTAADVDARGAEPLLTLVETPGAPVGVSALASGLGKVAAGNAELVEKETVTGTGPDEQDALDKLIFAASGSNLGVPAELLTAPWLETNRNAQAARRIAAGEVAENDVLRLALAGLLRESPYLKDSTSARELLQRVEGEHSKMGNSREGAGLSAGTEEVCKDSLWNRAELKACVVRVNLAGIARVSSKFMKAVPTSLARAEDRRELLAKFVKLTQLLLSRVLEALVKERPELRGAKLADALLARAEDVFSFYDLANVPGVDPEAVAQ